MFRLAIRSVLARWGRLVLTALAIVASTAFLAGTFIFRDTVERTFDALFAGVYERVDGYVQSTNTVEGLLGFERRDRLPATVVDQVADVPGVKVAQPYVQDDAVVIAKDGEPIERPTAPTFGATLNVGPFSIWKFTDGRAPVGPDEVVLESTTAEDAGYSVGDTVKVNAEAGSHDFTLVGIVTYDDIISPGNATWALFDDETASAFVARPGFIDAVLVQGDGTLSDVELSARVNAALDPDVAESLTSAQITLQTQSDVERSLGFVTLFLAIFSFIALGVGAFVIYNVFSVTASQRQRENALLRAVGASRRQVTWSSLVEALAVGVLGSLLGLAGGVGLALGIRNLLDALDYSIPARGLALETSTVVITLVAGIVTALIAAIAPAISAGRVPPVAAMSETAYEHRGSLRRRLIAAIVAIAVGVAGIVGVQLGADATFLGVAVVAIFTGVLLLGPLMANPIARFLGAPVERMRGVTGQMARGNVQRNPRRTARTAAPVLIGVALVAGATVFAASIKAQIREVVGRTFVGEYIINSTNGGGLSFSGSFVDEVNGVPEVGEATGLGFALLRTADGRSSPGAVVEPSTASSLLGYDFVAGSMEAMTADGILISSGEARGGQLALGSLYTVEIDGVDRPLRVEGIYRSNDFIPARTYNRHTFDGTSISNTFGFVILSKAGGVSEDEFRSAVGAVVEQYGIGELQNREQFIDSRTDIVDRTLTFIYGLLALSIVIAAFGIVLTLLLAVYERRRETGLLRAVGMNRAQVRTTVRWESVLTSLYGAITGVVLGLVLGWVVILSLRDEGLTKYSVPITAIAVILLLSLVVGVLAAVVPAWRATRLDILRAIAME